MVLASVYGPQAAWLLMMPGTWNEHRWTWIRMIPVLPGLLPAAMIERRWDLSEATTIGIAALVSFLISLALWVPSTIGRRTRLVIGCLTVIASSLYAFLLHAAFRA
ncbi:MAG: hypothetical protein GY895_18925 [Phycisphaera sp.]|nr:hypothetical protein [Phycisphaera sp.]